MNIGIFDSGRGGRFVAAKLAKILPENNYRVVDDSVHAPYGNRSYEQIRTMTETAIQPLVDTSDLIVIACNTATVAAIDYLRSAYPNVQFVGFEPMVKPAASLSASHHITLLATHATANSPRTRQLIEHYAPRMTIDIPETSEWARRIDESRVETIDLASVKNSVHSGSDCIIIGCTHYIAIQDKLESFGVTVLEPTEAIARRIRQLISETSRQ